MGAPMTTWWRRARVARPLVVAAFGFTACTRAACAELASRVPPAYEWAAERAGVPAPVLYAVALQESGTRLRGRIVPWPWTLNVAGRAERFASRVEACLGLRKAIAGAALHEIDAGLGQINLGSQARRYASACDLLDPYRNLVIAAQILREQHLVGEDWLAAVGRYHRPAGGTEAARYRADVAKRLAGMHASETSRFVRSTALP